MQLKPWQITAIRSALGVYSDRKDPPKDFVTFSHSVPVSAAGLTEPIKLVESIASNLTGVLTGKLNEIELILDSSSARDWTAKRIFLRDKENDKK